MNYKFILIMTVVIFASLNRTSFTMESNYQQKVSSSKKRKLRKQRAAANRFNNDSIKCYVLKKLFEKKNEPSVVPFELWFSYDNVEIAHEKDVSMIENFNLSHRNGIIDPFGDFIEWKILFDDFL